MKNHMRLRLHGNIVLHATSFMQLVASCKQAFTSHKHYAAIFRKRVIRITDAWPGQYTDTCISGYRMAECFIELGIWCFRAVKLCYLKLRTQTQRNDLLQDTPSVTKWSRMTYFKIGPSLVSDPATHWSYHRGKRSRSGGEGTSLDFSQNS